MELMRARYFDTYKIKFKGKYLQSPIHRTFLAFLTIYYNKTAIMFRALVCGTTIFIPLIAKCTKL